VNVYRHICFERMPTVSKLHRAVLHLTDQSNSETVELRSRTRMYTQLRHLVLSSRLL
jgi:hypothetical protein